MKIKDLKKVTDTLDDLEYLKDIEIDRHNLTEEWLDQGTRYLRWGVASVEASYLRDQIADEIDTVKAEVEEDIRNRPEKHGIENSSKTGAPTEAAIKMGVLKHKDVIDVKERFNEAKRMAALMAVGERAMNNRKTALERITDLEITGYNADPKGAKREEVHTTADRATNMDGMRKKYLNKKSTQGE